MCGRSLLVKCILFCFVLVVGVMPSVPAKANGVFCGVDVGGVRVVLSGTSKSFVDIKEYSDDPFHYLTKGWEAGAQGADGAKETKAFVRSGYQVLKYASVSGAAITGLACVIVLMVTRDPNKRMEKKRALFRKAVMIVGIFSLSWLLATLFSILRELG